MLASQSLDACFAALGDPTRRQILARLAAGERSVSDVVAGFDLTQPTISSHLRILERAGLIERRKVAQKRICRLRSDGIRPIVDWLDALAAQWDARLDRLARYAEDHTDHRETD